MSQIYTSEDHKIWHDLIMQQLLLVKEVACEEYLQGLELLDLTTNRIPVLTQISSRLTDLTGWSLVPVNTLVSNKIFFYMLANKQFPVVSTIRSRDELDFYTNESPDIVHEIFGHCPLITNTKYANSMWKFGNLAFNCNDETRQRLSKIFWATFEFGLLECNRGVKIYGAGILPSRTEIKRIIEGKQIIKAKLDIFSNIDAALQGNVVQSTYYTIDCLETLYAIIDQDIALLISNLSH